MFPLGEEADLAQCDNCGADQARDAGVECENCGGFYCRHICWAGHWCDELTDWNGRKVKEGDVLTFTSNPSRVYKVVEIPGTFRKAGIAYAERVERRPTGEKQIIRPRLMVIYTNDL